MVFYRVGRSTHLESALALAIYLPLALALSLALARKFGHLLVPQMKMATSIL